MRKIKAAFFDIDGTLVSLKTKVCPESAKQALAALRKAGVLCFVATGRSRFEIASEHLLDGLEFDGYLTDNGQDAYSADGTLLYAKSIPYADAAAILDWAERTGCACWVVGAEQSVLSHLDARTEEALAAIHTRPPRLAPVRPMLELPIYKIVLFQRRERVQEIETLAPSCVITEWYPLGQDVISKEGGKRRAMLGVLKQYGILPEECIAFGDSENDNEMLQAAGIGVAMGNAAPDTKAAADYITDDCDDDGLVNALKHFGVLQ